jgi:transposase
MLVLAATARIYLYRSPCDMRKSFDGLCGLVRSGIKAHPLSGCFFVFINRRRNLLKCLYWDRDGLALWYKRLEKGCFTLPDQCASDGPIDRLQLTLLLEGVVAKKVSRKYILDK